MKVPGLLLCFFPNVADVRALLLPRSLSIHVPFPVPTSASVPVPVLASTAALVSVPVPVLWSFSCLRPRFRSDRTPTPVPILVLRSFFRLHPRSRAPPPRSCPHHRSRPRSLCVGGGRGCLCRNRSNLNHTQHVAVDSTRGLLKNRKWKMVRITYS